jgi:ribonuclease P protein component
MLSSKYRFHGYGALKFLFGRGQTYRFKSMSVRVAQNPRRAHSRLAVVISKKVLKASPKRNRVRRRVYEFMRTNWQNIKPGHDILLSVYDPTLYECDVATVADELRHALQGAHIWVEPQEKPASE